jgi:hypothetical protein
MAQNWKKIIVSGSNAELNSLNVDLLVQVGANQIISSSAIDTKLSGSFSGSFVGDGSGLSGLATSLGISGSTGNDSINLLTEDLTITGSLPISTAVTNNTVTISIDDATTTTKGVASFNSNGFTVSSGVVSLANSTSGAVLNINGTTDEIEVSRSNGTVTVGLPNNVTIAQQITAGTGSITGNLEVGGDLIVNGTVTTINTTNLEVKDRFILLNSGSTQSATPKGGIIINTSGGSGNAFLYNDDASQERWGFNRSVSGIAQTGVISEAFAAAVISGPANQFDGFYDRLGNIRIDNDGEIFIWA